MNAPVSWETAGRVAAWLGSGKAPLGPSLPVLDDDAWTRLRDDFAEFTARAEDLVVAETGLRPDSGPPRAQVVDRVQWAQRNISSFRRLLEPVLAQVEGAGSLPGPLGTAARTTAGAQLGLVLGWMATRVLGQYDLLLAEGDDTGDVVSYVGPNIVAMERHHGFAPRQFRLWIALHEVTHRCQFTAVPWLRPHFLSLVDQTLSSMSPDPRRLADTLRRAARAAREGKNPLEDAGVLGLVAPPEQLEVIARIQAMMSLLEGHGDVTMSRAAGNEIPDAPRFARTLHERRARASFPARVLQQLLGIEAKLKQYAMGERFIAEVEEAGGPALLARVWEGPEMLPTMEEMRAPAKWVVRAGGRATLATG
ncbi:MAG: zinc-dependent metalloprotease [Acidimicrobiales bacterium]